MAEGNGAKGAAGTLARAREEDIEARPAVMPQGVGHSMGRRARLDLKLFRTFVLMPGEVTGGRRGEIDVGEDEEPEGEARSSEP